ncbi:MAG: YdgA family protein [Gallionellaceae bacterium]|jgi:uncharacterized protein YdgA (DUF945 family)|nr:YdgA family protein [Gallionellaceae bacterium]
MKKLIGILSVIVVLAVVWLGASWSVGQNVRSANNSFIEKINAAWAKNPQTAGLKLTELSFDHGLFSSHARYGMVMNEMSQDPLAEFDVAYSHGPFPIEALKQGNLSPKKYQAHVEFLIDNPQAKAMIGMLTNSKSLLTADFSCTYGKHCSGTGTVPAVNYDMAGVKLAWGGIQMQLDSDGDYLSDDTSYKVHNTWKILPLTINGLALGDGQGEGTEDAQSGSGNFSWKTDQGESKITVAFDFNKSLSGNDKMGIRPEELIRLIKGGSLGLSLSKAMIADMAAKIDLLSAGRLLRELEGPAGDQSGNDEAAPTSISADRLPDLRKLVLAKIDETLAQTPQAQKYIKVEGDLITADWKYQDNKVLINGQEDPVLTEAVKNILQRMAPRGVQQ